MGYNQRDPDEARAVLTKWLATRPGVDDVEVGEVVVPVATGWSNETLLFDASWAGRTHQLVARIEPSRHQVFLDPSFETQYHVMKALADHTDVPMPKLHWFEDDRSWLGGRFWIMDRVDGVVPSDSPPYSSEGWLKDSPPDAQRRLWLNGLDAMAKVHRVDWRALGLDEHGLAPGLDAQLAYYEAYLDWAATGRANPIARRALDWLRAEQPAELSADETAICWGDSRIGNQMSRDGEIVAVLDWEMVALGDPQQDLAWWLHIDRLLTEGSGLDRLPGLPPKDETVAHWEEATGRAADRLAYYEVFAGFRFTVIMTRLGKVLIEAGLVDDDELAYDNFVSKMLVRQLDDVGAGTP